MVQAVTRWGGKETRVIDGGWGRNWEPDTSSTQKPKRKLMPEDTLEMLRVLAENFFTKPREWKKFLQVYAGDSKEVNMEVGL